MAHILQTKTKRAFMSLLRIMILTPVKSRSSQDKTYYSRLPPHHPFLKLILPRHQQWTKVAVFSPHQHKSIQSKIPPHLWLVALNVLRACTIEVAL